MVLGIQDPGPLPASRAWLLSLPRGCTTHGCQWRQSPGGLVSGCLDVEKCAGSSLAPSSEKSGEPDPTAQGLFPQRLGQLCKSDLPERTRAAGSGGKGEAACPFTLPLSPSSWTAAQGSILSVLLGPELMGGLQSCASLGCRGESRYVWPLSSGVHWEEPQLRRQPDLVWILTLLLTNCVALG